MKLIKSFNELLALLPELADEAQVWLPAKLAETLPDQPEALLTSLSHLLLSAPGNPVRDGYVNWLDIAQLRSIMAKATDTSVGDTLCAYFGRAKPCLELQQPPPAVVWPNLPDNAARLEWYRQCIAAYAETLHSISCEPLSLFELDQLEQALGCALPTLLREYLHQLGYLNLAETLIVPEPLLDFYPGIEDILEDLPADEAIGERAVVESLVAFGDYLGNGNAWCFHRETGAVWYFDHDSPPHWQPMFPRIEDYLDSLMLLSLMQGVDDDIDENLFRQRFGDALIEKWMY